MSLQDWLLTESTLDFNFRDMYLLLLIKTFQNYQQFSDVHKSTTGACPKDKESN